MVFRRDGHNILTGLAMVLAVVLFSGTGLSHAETQMRKEVAPIKQAPAKIKRLAPTMQKPQEVDMRPDLTLGACEVLCNRGGGYSAQVCQQFGYSDQFTYKVQSTIRNDGKGPASIEAGWRIWGATHQVGSGPADPAGSAQLQGSPAGGIYLTEGAEVPGSSSPVLYNLKNLAPGTHTVVFTADPDNHVAEKNEANNSALCAWTVVAGQAAVPFDLTITSVSVSPSSGPPGTAFYFTVKVKNIGGPTFTPINTSCQPGVGFNNPKIEENEVITTTYQIPGTMTPGQKTITCNVSSTGYNEQNTSNNTMTGTFTVTQP